jgi:hypothetical protein
LRSLRERIGGILRSILKGAENCVGARSSQFSSLGFVAGRNSQLSIQTASLEDLQEREVEIAVPHCAHDPTSPMDGQLVQQLRVAPVAVENRETLFTPECKDLWIEVHTQDLFFSLDQVLCDLASVVSQAQQNNFPSCFCSGCAALRFSIRVLPFEKSQERSEDLIEFP